MKQFRALFICFVFIFVATRNGNAADNAKLPAQDCAVTFKRFYKQFSSEYAEFTLTNATSHAVWFTGQHLEDPDWEIQFFKNGSWEHDALLKCGVGWKRLNLRSHQSTTFRVPIRYEQEWNYETDKLQESDRPMVMRVGVSCSTEKDYKKDVQKTYWSERVVLLK